MLYNTKTVFFFQELEQSRNQNKVPTKVQMGEKEDKSNKESLPATAIDNASDDVKTNPVTES